MVEHKKAPENGAYINDTSSLTITGQTEIGTELIINGEAVLLDSLGEFNHAIFIDTYDIIVPITVSSEDESGNITNYN